MRERERRRASYSTEKERKISRDCLWDVQSVFQESSEEESERESS